MAGRRPQTRHISMDYIRAIRPVVRHHSACLNRRDSEAFINEVTLHAVLRLHPRDMRNLATVDTRHCATSIRALLRVIEPFFSADLAADRR